MFPYTHHHTPQKTAGSFSTCYSLPSPKPALARNLIRILLQPPGRFQPLQILPFLPTDDLQSPLFLRINLKAVRQVLLPVIGIPIVAVRQRTCFVHDTNIRRPAVRRPKHLIIVSRTVATSFRYRAVKTLVGRLRPSVYCFHAANTLLLRWAESKPCVDMSDP